MFVCLYDKDFKALGNWSTYATTKWSLIRKSYEFDELSVTTREMENSINAMYIGLHNDDGSLKYLGYSGKPTTKDGLTTYKGTDLRQIYKSKLAIDLTNVGISDIYDATSGNVSKTKLQQVYEYLLGLPFRSQREAGYIRISYDGGTTYTIGSGEIRIIIDTTDIGLHDPLTSDAQGWHEEWINRTPGIGEVWEMIQGFNSMYDCYVEFVPDLNAKTVTARVRRIYELISFKLSDFNESKVLNDTTVTNRVVVRKKSTDDDTIGTEVMTAYLYGDDTVMGKSGAGVSHSFTEAELKKIILPVRCETILCENSADAQAEAISKAYQTVLNNRFKGKVEIGTDCSMGYLLKQIDLNTFADIYGYNAADNNTKRRLPVMQISEDSSGRYRVSFGRLTQYWY